MTPSNTDTPLRRSELGTVRDKTLNMTMNDDEEERREGRRRTLLASRSVASSTSTTTDSPSTIEESENLKKCMEIYNGNKLSRDNAWSMSLIDTLTTLLDRHHKSLNNFKVAGTSLEASSKVYGLRVDSVHTDVLRMSAGLNAQKFKESNFADRDDNDDDDNVATGGDGAADPTVDGSAAAAAQKPTKAKRQRKAVATVTKNKDTLNGRLDTVPLQDPVFGKLNTTVGSINASDRLMNNILFTNDSELRLRTTFPFWDDSPLEADCVDYTEEVLKAYDGEEVSAEELDAESDAFVPIERLIKYKNMDHLLIRPMQSGYIISDTPEIRSDDSAEDRSDRRLSDDSLPRDNDELFGPDGLVSDALERHGEPNHLEMSMAFDMNAECEPMPELMTHTPIVDVDFNQIEDMTREERTAIDRCRGLRVQPIIIEDLRPVDSTSTLEYSYRPMDKISQFWAGPSHWKFKRARRQPNSTLTSVQGTDNASTESRNRRATQRMQAKSRRFKKLNFCDNHDEKFIPINSKCKARKVNLEKRWDKRKLKLPTDLQLDVDMFSKLTLMLGFSLDTLCQGGDAMGTVDDDGVSSMPDDHFADSAPLDDVMLPPHLGGGDAAVDGNLSMGAMGMSNDCGGLDDVCEAPEADLGDDSVANNTVLEIATDYEGAPSQVMKIVVPFAKRAKVIDMKGLKRSCTTLITKQMQRPVAEETIPQHPIAKKEHYAKGVASFREVYTHLPELLTHQMSEALSPSVAFYSVLHLANECHLRLIPQDNLKDFKIRQVTNETDFE